MTTYENNTSSKPRRHHLTRVGAALLLTGCIAACNSNEKTPKECTSPRAASTFFAADPSATADRTTWKNGIAIHTEVPADAKSVIVGYRAQNADTWNDSLPVSPDRAETIAVLLGDGAVSFSIQLTAVEGSTACANEPNTTFSKPQSMQTLIATDATLPQW